MININVNYLGDLYGLKPKQFLENLCAYQFQTNEESRFKSGEKISLEIVSTDLKRLICYEAKSNSKGRKPDFKTTFELFDQDKSGAIKTDEFKKMLKQLHLINTLADHQIPSLIAMFDKTKKNSILLSDFIAFAEDGNKDLLNDDFDDEEDNDDNNNNFFQRKQNNNNSSNNNDDENIDDDDEDEDQLINSNTPPVVISKNSDCDWLLWYLYKQCCRLEPLDAESVVIELQGFLLFFIIIINSIFFKKSK
jgi:Ca2+-binding EF-hand superfamily protein